MKVTDLYPSDVVRKNAAYSLYSLYILAACSAVSVVPEEFDSTP